jgi:hypothetical protein
MVIGTSSSVFQSAAGKGGRSKRAGVDLGGRRIIKKLSVVFTNQYLELPDGRLVVGDTPGEGELISDTAGS